MVQAVVIGLALITAVWLTIRKHRRKQRKLEDKKNFNFNADENSNQLRPSDETDRIP